jgi:hypothetical protein
LCRAGPGKRWGKHRKWLIHMMLSRLTQTLNPLVEGSNPSGPTSIHEDQRASSR